MKTKIINPDSHEITGLVNCCMTAAQEFRKHAETFRALIDHKPAPDAMMQIHGDGARRVMQQFLDQAEQASHFCQMFQAVAEPITLTYDEEMVEED